MATAPAAKGGAAPAGPVLRVTQIWRGEVMEDLVFAEPANVLVGGTKGCTFVVPDLGLPPKFRLFKPSGHRYVLTLGKRMSGKLSLGGQTQGIPEFLASGGAGRADGAAGDFRALPISPGDWGIVHADGQGDHTFFFQFTRPEAPLPRQNWNDSELLLPAFLFSAAVFGLILLAAMVMTDANPTNVLGFPPSPEGLTGYLVRRPEPPPPLSDSEPMAGTEDGDEEAPPASAEGEEGKSGGEGKKPRARTPDPGPPAPSSRDAIVRVVRNKGILKHRDRLAAVGGRSLFDDRLGSAMSDLRGDNEGGIGYGRGKGSGVGPGEGTGTLTKGSGKGPGGGGTAHADVVTQGAIKTGGRRAPKGVPGGKAITEVAVNVSYGRADGDFNGLSKEQVDRVVRAHRNAILYCYEKELQRKRDLSGKIVVTWKIERTGSVSMTRVKQSTMKDSAVESCLVRQVKKWKFPTSDGITMVHYPFIFAGR